MTTKERIKIFLKHRKISERQFYRSTGFSNSFLATGKHIGTDKAEIIISTYPEMNLYWLITGKGDMILPVVLEPDKDKEGELIKELRLKMFELEVRLDECRRKNEVKNVNDSQFQK
ncbi:MAG: hypothetical protein ABFS35_21505 [Bacteroidota bacterium]